MVFKRLLGTINGTVIGAVIGLAITSQAFGTYPLPVVVAAFSGAFTASALTGLKPIPGSLGGVAGGLVGVGLSLFPLPMLAFPLPGFSAYAIGGAVGGVVALRLPPLR